MRFLIETALLTHGLASVSNEELLAAWPFREPCLAWMEDGRVCTGSMEEFLPFRDRADEVVRVSCHSLDRAAAEKRQGALTASGTMLAAGRMGIPAAVTCGMGGIGDIRGETLCPDLPAVRDLPVALIAATPKDVVDIGATLCWFRREHVPVYGRYEAFDSGFMAVGERFSLDGVWDGSFPKAPLLLLNPIPEADRPGTPEMVAEAKAAGKAAEVRGEAYHPAANRVFDRASGGLTSRLQLRQLIENGLWARELTEEKG